MNCTITLKATSFSNVPFDNYQKDFTFIVNDEEFSTNKIIADILSKKISRNHLTDPTIDRYSIKTKNKGNFQTILNLITFKSKEIPENEIPFLSEIIQLLESEINIEIDNERKLTVDNAIDMIHFHEQSPQFYSKNIEKEIEFISENFYQIAANQKEKFLSLSKETIELILSNSKLRLENENQLLDFVNSLYSYDSTNSNLYDFVLFTYVDALSINQFVSIFDIDHITKGTWNEISKRLKHEISCENEEPIQSNRYIKPIEKITANAPFKSELFNGIFKYLQTNSNIKDEVEITFSSTSGYGDPFNLLQFDNLDNYFYPKRMNSFNQWICFEFKKHKIIPSNYTIRSEKSNKTGGYHPKSWVIEGSNDNDKWDTIDEQKNCSYLNGSSLVYTFNINSQNETEFKYVRMRLTEPNWYNNEILLLNSIEFYGKII